MGQEVNCDKFTKKQYEQFNGALRAELDTLFSLEKSNKFLKTQDKVGLELEGWLVDGDSSPSDSAMDFIKKTSHEQVVPEISKFNFEINSTPFAFTGDCFKKLSKELKSIWKSCNQEDGYSPMLIGTLPTLNTQMLTLDVMTPETRYSVMNRQVMDMRQREPLKIKIEGKEKLELTMDSVIAECAATSLQIHLGVSLEKSAKYYNASLISSSFLVAVSANAPFLFGQELWDESRIKNFEQAVDLTTSEKKFKRVTLGNGFVKDSILELFQENVQDYPVLLPQLFDESDKFQHLNFHNGTIWRWTRPILSMGERGPNLRIEQRAPSAGPTFVDTIANTMFFLGLIDYIASANGPLEEYMSFEDVEKNFYAAAKDSLNCEVQWLDGTKYPINELLLEKILPKIIFHLHERGIHEEDIEFYIGKVMKGRLERKLNGAIWQKNYVAKHGKDFKSMLAKYRDYQKKNTPIHLWDLN